MSVQVLNPRKRRVFESVFGAPDISLPTPHATPATNFAGPGQSWGGLPPKNLDDRLQATLQGSTASQQPLFPRVDDHVEDQVRWDRAWHLVTHTLSLPRFTDDVTEPREPIPRSSDLDDKFHAALGQVLNPEMELPRARQTEDLVVWYTAQVRHDFLHQVLPVLESLKANFNGEELLGRSVKVLELVKRQYSHGLRFIAQGMERVASSGAGTAVVQKFQRELNAIVGESVMQLLKSTLRDVLRTVILQILKFRGTQPSAGSFNGQDMSVESLRADLLGLVQALHHVGLVGEKFQVILADIMNEAMSVYIKQACQGQWNFDAWPQDSQGADARHRATDILPRAAHQNPPSPCVVMLCEWVENQYAKLIVQVFGILNISGAVTLADLDKYKEMAIGRLADLRISELFDIVASWPNARGGLEDLRTAITTAQRRLHLTEAYVKTMQQRLLQPGTSTLQILQTYISMIWSFHKLDHSKVLLDRVAYPLQLYLFSREDTVRIIIMGLLAETEDESGKPTQYKNDKLYELAHLLKNNIHGSGTNDEELDWHDMEWMPDPVDAGPGYKRSKNADVIGTLIGVLGTQDVFIKEFQNIIGESLLREHSDHHHSFQREESVLQLLKLRFGEPPLQACEVMLKDIYDSETLTRQIRSQLQPSFANPFLDAALPRADIKDPALDTKILSRLFWPSTVMDQERFKIPDEVAARQQSYERAFEERKSKRKLTWLNALGQAEVELELQDRTIKEECSTWVASVIHAFAGDDVSRTAEELEELLEMDEDLVAEALRFWLSRRVLVESSPGTFTVLETLPSSTAVPSSSASSSTLLPGTEAAPTASTSTSATRPGPSSSTTTTTTTTTTTLPRPKAKDRGIYGDKSPMYWNFVKGMLTNAQKEMPTAQIGMMLKMMIPGGFPHGNEELAEWLGDKAAGGELSVEKGKWRLSR